jgi:AcrR family transcriptional regulator
MPARRVEREKPNLREMQRAFTRQRMIDVARELFGQQGYFATTIDQIVSTVGMSRPTFYVHFTDKEEILEELIRAYTERAVAEMETMPGPRPTLQKVHEWLLQVARFVEREKVMVALLLEASADARSVPSYVLATVDTLFGALSHRSPAFARALRTDAANAEARAQGRLLLAQITWAATMYWKDKGSPVGEAAIKITAQALHSFMNDRRYQSLSNKSKVGGASG